MRHYIGVIHKDAGSDYGVSFPDFPGAVTAAHTIDEAVEMAQEALALHVEGMLAEGETIPEPSKFDQVRDEPEFSDGIPVLVPLKTDALVMRVNVTLPAAILRRIDEHAEELGLTRSGFLAEAARHELDNDPVRRWLSHSLVKTEQDKVVAGSKNHRAPTLEDWLTALAPETVQVVLGTLMQLSVMATAEGELVRAEALGMLARVLNSKASTIYHPWHTEIGYLGSNKPESEAKPFPGRRHERQNKVDDPVKSGKPPIIRKKRHG